MPRFQNVPRSMRGQRQKIKLRGKQNKTIPAPPTERKRPTNIDMYPDILSFTDEEICEAIAQETKRIMEFWKNDSAGWAPVEAAEILTRSMLDWQSSLARTLKIWLGRESDGE